MRLQRSFDLYWEDPTTLRFRPGRRERACRMRFQRFRSSTLTPYCWATLHSVSPSASWWMPGFASAAGEGVAAVVAGRTGVAATGSVLATTAVGLASIGPAAGPGQTVSIVPIWRPFRAFFPRPFQLWIC